AIDVDSVHLLVAGVHLGLAVALHAEILEHGGAVLQEIELLAAQLRIPPLHFQVLFGIELTDHDHAMHAESVGAHAGYVPGDVVVHAVDYRHDGDEGGGREDDPEERQEAAQLARAERSGGAEYGFPKRGIGLHLVTERRAAWRLFRSAPTCVALSISPGVLWCQT